MPLVVAVDFDGTCVEHRYPAVGPEVPNAVAWLKFFAHNGVKIILYTMRSDERPFPNHVGSDHTLSDAIKWFEERGIPLFGINENPDQGQWTRSRKVYANVYIDDAAAGCPMIQIGTNPPYVDWGKVGPDVCRRLGLGDTTSDNGKV